ncbi:MAG: hypothetical protein ACR2O0_06425 [Rhizobiaceae bacterium]
MRLAISLIAAFVSLAMCLPASAQEDWKIREVEDREAFLEAIAETRVPAPSEIPNMLTATEPASPTIVEAWYSYPTGRYRHGVLGDAIEAGALVVKLKNGRTITLRLPETQVFEDIAPRIADLDNDGRPEVVTILSSLNRGASIAVFGLSGNALVKIASTPFIGIPNRWLNIAGIASFTGNSAPEIAFVTTPHIGGRLGFLRYVPNTLLSFGGMAGFSNHVIGSPELRLSAIADVNDDGRPDLALPSADRMTLRIVGFTNSGFSEIGRARLPAPIDKAILTGENDGEPIFTVGLEDGSVYEVYK